jgi:hypothetical protein
VGSCAPHTPIAAVRLILALLRRPARRGNRSKRRALGLTRLRVWPKSWGVRGNHSPALFKLEKYYLERNSVSGGLQTFCKVILDSHDDELTRNSLENKDPTEKLLAEDGFHRLKSDSVRFGRMWG